MPRFCTCSSIYNKRGMVWTIASATHGMANDALSMATSSLAIRVAHAKGADHLTASFTQLACTIHQGQAHLIRMPACDWLYCGAMPSAA